MNAVCSARLETTPKRCELPLFLATIGRAVCRWKALNLGRLNMQFQKEWPKDKKNYSSFNFLAENLEKFRSPEHYGAAIEGSTIFLCRSSLGSTAMENCRLAELKYAIFSRTGRKTKKLPRSKVFLSMAWAPGRINISISIQLHDPCTIGKLSIRRVKICNFTRRGRKTEE